MPVSYSAKLVCLTQSWNPSVSNFLPLPPSVSHSSKPLAGSMAFKIVFKRNAFNMLMAKRFIFYFRNKTSTKNKLMCVIKNQTRFKPSISVSISHSSATQPCLLHHQLLAGFVPLPMHHFFFLLLNFIFFFVFSSRLRFVPVSVSLSSVHLNLDISFSVK